MLYFNFSAPKNVQVDAQVMRFQKFLLGVHAKSSNDGVRGELGTFPLIIDTEIQLIKYWHRFMNLPEDSLLREAYNVVLFRDHDWIGHVKNILNYNGFGHIWLNPNLYHIDAITSQLRQRLRDIYVQNWHCAIRNNSKLSVLSTLNKQYKQESYLSNIRSLDVRRAITALRISCHKLSIETGRFQKIPKDQRVCPHCPEQIEDEFHFLIECPKYNVLRNNLYTCISFHTPEFSSIDHRRKFNYMLTCDTPCIIQIGQYIKRCLDIRN